MLAAGVLRGSSRRLRRKLLVAAQPLCSSSAVGGSSLAVDWGGVGGGGVSRTVLSAAAHAYSPIEERAQQTSIEVGLAALV